MNSRRAALLLLGSAFITGCVHQPPNARLRALDPNSGYRFQTVAPQANADDLLLILAFSGGGTRAASLSYGVLEQLANTGVGTPAGQHRLLDDVGMISSVSGGSFTAAYYALWGDRIFTDFEPRFLKKKVETALLLRVLAPWNQVRLLSPTFSRSDLAAEYYDELLFKGATFADLSRHNGLPFLSVNATDLASGARFEFTQDEFDLIHSDLSSFSISRAVAASSAFPVYLTPVVLKNYSAEGPQEEPHWIRSITDNPSASARLQFVATQARSYLDGHRRFIHLLDGALADNLGLRGALDRAIAREEYTRVPSVPMNLPHKVAVIVVDAHTDSDYGWDSKEHSLGLGALLGSLSQVAVSHYSFETIELFRAAMARIARDQTAGQTNRLAGAENSTYVIELHFNQLANAADRHFFNAVPTSLQLPSRSVDRLRYLAARELAENREFRRLVADLNGDSATDTPLTSAPSRKSAGN